MNIRNNFKHTVFACYIGYITQAIVNNFAPLLFVTFQKSYDISLKKIGFLITANFLIQLFVDFVAAKFVDKIGYRTSIVAAHLFSGTGMILLSFLPDVFSSAYTGLIVSIVFCSIGGGLIEVLISPIVEACPGDKKSAAMSLLHSFYCWGHVGVILLTTLFFVTAGIENWRILACVWAIIPLANSIYFIFVPINKLVSDEKKTPVKELLKSKVFWMLIVLMLCAGASEQALSQWSSLFAETGLNVSKTLGDLLGPCFFAALMGLSRVLYATFSEKLELSKVIEASCVLCVICYLTAALAPNPIISLLGCAFCGFSVGILWPGVYSIAAQKAPRGGTTMFAYLALAGDLGCSSGPTVAGMISSLFNDNLKTGFIFSIIFPVTLIVFIRLLNKSKENSGI